MNAYESITDALRAAGCKQRGNDWTCPLHKDGTENNPSLSVNYKDGRVLLHCHAGCPTDDVLRAIGKTFADCKDKPLEVNGNGKVPDTYYDYFDALGNLRSRVVRKAGKRFLQCRPNNEGGWDWSIKGVEKIPYHLPELLAGISRGDVVYIPEGEKDVEAIMSAGGVATTNSGGAGKWPVEFGEYFRNASVVIVADKDEAGIKHAQVVADSIAPYVSSYSIKQARFGKDAADHLAAGHTLSEFDPLEESPSESLIVVNSLRADLLKEDDIDNLPRPQYLIEDFIVADSLAVLYGQPGHGKSFVALDWAMSVAHDIGTWMGKEVMFGPVLYLVAEGLTGYGVRKRAWRSAHEVEQAGELQWLRRPVDLLNKSEAAQLIELCDEEQPIFVVIDTLGRCMPGADENAPAPMSEIIGVLDEIRSVTRSCVMPIHHTPHEASRPRGHSSFYGAVQSAIKVSMEDGIVSLTVDKQKDDEPISMQLRLVKEGESAVLEGGTEGGIVIPRSYANEKAIETYLSETAPPEGATTSIISEAIGVSPRAARRSLTDLTREQRLIHKGWRYRINENPDQD